MTVGWDRSEWGLAGRHFCGKWRDEVVSEWISVVGAFLAFHVGKRGTDRRLRKYVFDVKIV